eukprot:603923-Rhodomonas_salina.3
MQVRGRGRGRGREGEASTRERRAGTSVSTGHRVASAYVNTGRCAGSYRTSRRRRVSQYRTRRSQERRGTCPMRFDTAGRRSRDTPRCPYHTLSQYPASPPARSAIRYLSTALRTVGLSMSRIGGYSTRSRHRQRVVTSQTCGHVTDTPWYATCSTTTPALSTAQPILIQYCPADPSTDVSQYARRGHVTGKVVTAWVVQSRHRQCVVTSQVTWSRPRSHGHVPGDVVTSQVMWSRHRRRGHVTGDVVTSQAEESRAQTSGENSNPSADTSVLVPPYATISTALDVRPAIKVHFVRQSQYQTRDQLHCCYTLYGGGTAPGEEVEEGDRDDEGLLGPAHVTAHVTQGENTLEFLAHVIQGENTSHFWGQGRGKQWERGRRVRKEGKRRE